MGIRNMSSSTDTPSTPFLGSETDMESVVNNVLQPDLDASRDHKFITENDECFVPADEFRKHWNIGDEPWRNFVRLLCGCTRFPFLLLQNPSNVIQLLGCLRVFKVLDYRWMKSVSWISVPFSVMMIWTRWMKKINGVQLKLPMH